MGASAAPEIDRETFVKRADAICKPAHKKADPLLNEAIEHLEDEETEQAARPAIRGYRILRKAFQDVAKLNRPSHLVGVIRHWLDLQKRSLRVGIDASQEMRAGHYRPALRLFLRSDRIRVNAEFEVRGWHFKSCA